VKANGFPLRIGELEDKTPVTIHTGTLLRHLVCFGATGSGKTVASKVLCEELLKQRVPVIAIDPQGDIASMALKFSGKDVGTSGLAAAAEFVVWTPASSAGRQVCVRPFGVDLPQDREERVRSIGRLAMNVTELLGLSRRDIDKARAIAEIVLTDAAEKKRFPKTFADLSARLELPSDDLRERVQQVADLNLVERMRQSVNRLSIGSRKLLFEDGEPLDVEAMLGLGEHAGPRTRMSIVYLNTLSSQEEKDFFIGLLVEQLYCWMLKRPSSTLQAVLYIDELAPFLPPVRKTACKEGLLLLIRQARKYGIGMILATQNIGDLDYKSLNQCSSWLLGKSSARRELEKASDQLRSLPGYEADRVLSELPNMQRGQFVLLSPDEHEGPQRVKIRWLESAHETLDEERLRILPKTTAAIRGEAGEVPSGRLPSGLPEGGGESVVRSSDRNVAPSDASRAMPAPETSADRSRSSFQHPAGERQMSATPPADYFAQTAEVRLAQSSPAPSPPKPASDREPVRAHFKDSTPVAHAASVAGPLASSLEGGTVVAAQLSVPSAAERTAAVDPRVEDTGTLDGSAGLPLASDPRSGGNMRPAPIKIDVSLRQDFVPVNPTPYAIEMIVRLRTTAEAAAGRVAMTLVAVIDQSGSMADESKLERVKEAVARIAGALGPQDRLALIGFSEDAMSHIPIGRGATPERMRDAIRSLSTLGGTKMSAGLELAWSQLRSSMNPEHVNRLLLLTDGQTAGDHQRCHDLAREIRTAGVGFDCIAVGTDWDQPFLTELSAGSLDFLKGSDEITQIFERLQRRLQSVVVRRVTLGVEAIGKTRLENALHCRRDSASGEGETMVMPLGRGPSFAIDELALDREEVLVLPLVFTPSQEGRFVLAQVRAEGTYAGAPFLATHEVAVTVTSDRSRYELVNKDAVEILGRIHVKRAHNDALQDIQSGDPQRVTRGTNRLRGTTKRLDEMGEHELAKLTRRVIDQVETSNQTDSPEAKAVRQITKRL